MVLRISRWPLSSSTTSMLPIMLGSFGELFRLDFGRQDDRKDGPLAKTAGHEDFAAMFPDNPLGDCQPQADAGLLGREIRLKNLRDILGRNPFPLVGEGQAEHLRF